MQHSCCVSAFKNLAFLSMTQTLFRETMFKLSTLSHGHFRVTHFKVKMVKLLKCENTIYSGTIYLENHGGYFCTFVYLFILRACSIALASFVTLNNF